MNLCKYKLIDKDGDLYFRLVHGLIRLGFNPIWDLKTDNIIHRHALNPSRLWSG